MTLETALSALVGAAGAEFVRWTIRGYRAWRRRSRPPAARQLVERQARLRKEIADHFGELFRNNEHPEIIVRNTRRLKKYPKVREYDAGISPWFKTEINDLYHRGIEVFLSGADQAIPIEDEHGQFGGWRLVGWSERVDGAVTAWPVGRIPFEFIESIDWDGDEYYGAPHFYCRFDSRWRDPYEEIVYKGILYPTVSKTYLEMHGLEHRRETTGPIRRYWILARNPLLRLYRWQLKQRWDHWRGHRGR